MPRFRSFRSAIGVLLASAVVVAGASTAFAATASAPPTAPRSFTLKTVDGTTIRASWTPGTAQGAHVIKQTIARDGTNASGGGPYRKALPSSARTYDFVGMRAGSTYKVTLRVKTRAGTTSTTKTVKVPRPSTPAPSPAAPVPSAAPAVPQSPAPAPAPIATPAAPAAPAPSTPSPAAPSAPSPAAGTAAPGSFGSAVMITPAKIAQLKDVVARKTEPNYTAWLKLLASADQEIGTAPEAPSAWYVPNAYKDPDGHYKARTTLQRDANGVYTLGLVYAVTGDEKYAKQAARVIDAWTKVGSFSTADDSRLSFSYHFPAMIFGADLIDDSPSSPASLDSAFAGLIRRTLPTLSTAHTNDNNWGSWGMVFEASAAAYLKDRALFDKAVARHKAIQEKAIDANGVLVHEVRREGGAQGNGSSGLWYANFALMPMTYTAEIFRINGVDVYDYVSPSGGSLKKAWVKVAGWNADPSSFSFRTDGQPGEFSPLLMGHVEMLNDRWPNADARKVLDANRPAEGRHSLVGVTFTHGGLPLC